tara:strand:+ start:116 stop:496 length:381 start_codon:yes stop_codon:yes gene_type:complete
MPAVEESTDSIFEAGGAFEETSNAEAAKYAVTTPEYTGGSVSYYVVDIENPTSGGDPYTAECNDIIEALGMNYAEGNAFKAIWRLCAARTLGKAKASYKDGVYDSEKVEFFGKRMVVQEKAKAGGK